MSGRHGQLDTTQLQPLNHDQQRNLAAARFVASWVRANVPDNPDDPRAAERDLLEYLGLLKPPEAPPITGRRHLVSTGQGHGEETRRKAIHLYDAQRLTSQEVAERLGIGRTTVSGWIRAAGVSRSPVSRKKAAE